MSLGAARVLFEVSQSPPCQQLPLWGGACAGAGGARGLGSASTVPGRVTGSGSHAAQCEVGAGRRLQEPAVNRQRLTQGILGTALGLS